MVKMKRKTQKHQTNKNIKFNNALHASRCTAVRDKTLLQYTFFMVRNLPDYRLNSGFAFANI